MNVWFATASRDRDQASECLRAWREAGYKTAALFVLGMETIVEADVNFFISDFQSHYDALNIATLLLAQQHKADVVVAGGVDARPDLGAIPSQVAANAFAVIPDGCFVMRPETGPLWLGRGWIEQAYRGQGPFWPEYKTSWADVETAVVAGRLGRLIEMESLRQEGATPSILHDAVLFSTRKAESFPESTLWEP